MTCKISLCFSPPSWERKPACLKRERSRCFFPYSKGSNRVPLGPLLLHHHHHLVASRYPMEDNPSSLQRGNDKAVRRKRRTKQRTIRRRIRRRLPRVAHTRNLGHLQSAIDEVATPPMLAVHVTHSLPGRILPSRWEAAHSCWRLAGHASDCLPILCARCVFFLS